MSQNIFSPTTVVQPVKNGARDTRVGRPLSQALPDYSVAQSTIFDHIVSFLIGFSAGFAVLFVFYKLIPISIVGGLVVGVVYIFAAKKAAIKKRLTRLRVQFFDMLEAMGVAMRAGNPVLKSLESARSDLVLIYSEKSDIIAELDAIVQKFQNAVPLSEAFSDFAERSGLEDVASFASVYATIEGKSSRADEIIRDTQQIIADKMEIEMEIDTLMTAAKSEVNIMLFMPLVILLVIGYAGAGFMDAIYQSALGRLVATGGLLAFIVSFILARKFSNVEI